MIYTASINGATIHIANSHAAGVTRCFRTVGELWVEAAVIPGGRPVCRQCARQAAPVQVNTGRTTDHAAHVARRQDAAARLVAEVTATDLTATSVTRVAKAVTAQTPMITTQIAPGAFRTRLKYEATGDNALRLLKQVATWFVQNGYDTSVTRERSPRSHGTDAYLLTVIDSPRREREVAEQAQRRADALAKAAAELSAPAERITCAQCGAELTRVQPADGGSYWGHADPALDGHPETARRGPSPEVVKAAVAQLQAELTANADAIGAILSEPLPGEDSPEPGPVSVAESINPREWSVRRDGELLGTVRRERGRVEWWEAVDTSGIVRVRKADTRSDAAARLVAGIDQRAADTAEREAANAVEGQRWAPQRQLPSGKYGVRLDTARTYTGPEPVLHVVQLIKPATVDSPARWGATPGRWGATTLAGHTGSTLAIDYGQGWALDEVDTAYLVAYAAELSTC